MTLIPKRSPSVRRVFGPATRASVQKMQQQFGLPVNGVWGHMERQVFDNARASAGAMDDPREMVGRVHEILERALEREGTADAS